MSATENILNDVNRTVLNHYKHRIQQTILDEEVKKLASSQLTQDLTELTEKIDTALNEWNNLGGASSEEADRKNKMWWYDKYREILTAAKEQFKRDKENLRKW